LLPNLLKSLL
uniref:Temporin-1Tk n=1 Tax=Rana temporaria TaxID=8407 RepID=TPK_RANTE|nr:RecName: Full=Temporin-1Tk; Short=TK; AltName: Full=Temporin-K [Rana temporaria]